MIIKVNDERSLNHMRKLGFLCVCIILVLVSVACNTKSEKKEGNSTSQKPVQSQITITELQKKNTLQEDELQVQKDKSVIVKVDDSDVIKKFTNAMKDSEKIQGVGNVAPPNYEVTIKEDGNESSYYLWININDKTKKSNAMYMNKGNTNTGYKITTDKTNSLIKFLNEIKK